MLSLRAHPKLLQIWIAIVLVALSTASARAVIILGGDGTGNTTAPADSIGDPGWVNVGRGNNSCVYLGNRWVLTCAHVGAANTTFNGTAYNLVPGSSIRLNVSEGNGTDPIDLILYRINAQPAGLASLRISTSSPACDSLVTAVGYGANRGESTAYGFLWGANTGTKRWGRNVVSSTYSGLINTGYGSNHVFQTSFNKSPSLALDPHLAFNEFQAASGDSGGAVFAKDAEGWKLSGIIEAVSTAGNANYGDTTYSIDLSFYADQINAALATCPFSGTIVDPVSTLGSGVSAYLSGNGGFKPAAGNCSVSVDTKSYSFTFDTGPNTINQTGVISGSGGLVKYGTGNLILSEDNLFSGTTYLNQGKITLDGGDLGNCSLLSMSASARLDVKRGNVNLTNITGSGSVSILGSATLTLQSLHADTLTIGSPASFAAAVPEPATPVLLLAFLSIVPIVVYFKKRTRFCR
jgi:autotransporter-associated beta strand protein